MAESITNTLDRIIDDLSAAFARRGIACDRVDTHISTVLLAGDEAYKFKKPVNLGFLDFSNLAQREYFCQREVTLNRRFAPEIYRGVVLITRVGNEFIVGGTGPAVEFAVRMHRFAQTEQLDQLIEAGKLDASAVEALGKSLAEGHLGAPRAAGRFGTSALAQIQMAGAVNSLTKLEVNPVGQYRARLAASVTLLAARHEGGFIRDCHGDLHASNIVRIGSRWVPFDCIEFDDELRFIDTLSDIAFLLMDFDYRGARALSNHLLNTYLATCGDYTGLKLLPLYCAYRSLVRAQVAELSRRHTTVDVQSALLTRQRRHLLLAAQYLSAPPPLRLVITHGLAGSGKSWESRRLAAAGGYIILRSDVERRRLNGVPSTGSTESEVNAGIYNPTATSSTYDRLAALCGIIILAGYSVIVDACFLRRDQRARFRQLADRLHAGFAILDCDAPLAVLQARIVARTARGDDPSEATLVVLAQQMTSQEPLVAEESRFVIQPLGGSNA